MACGSSMRHRPRTVGVGPDDEHVGACHLVASPDGCPPDFADGFRDAEGEDGAKEEECTV